jgi:hypothetical protein
MRMMRREQLLELGMNQRGAVAVLVALIFPVLLILGSFVIDIGNWFRLERHLQTQADAGALAGAQNFTVQNCSDGQIISTAKQYSGLSGGATPMFNAQIAGTPASNINEFINQQTYPPQPNQPAPDPDSMTGSPCNDSMLDLKVTQTPLPWYFQALGVGGINAHARVSIEQQTGGTGFLPVAVNETSPVAARAYFIDESASSFTALASVPLTDTGTKNTNGQAVWNNATPLPVAITKPNIGVVIALSGDPNNTTCPSTSQFVNCYDATPSLVHIQGWSALGTGTVMAPRARSVTLQPAGCGDGYFSNVTTSCTFGVAAKVDVGATPNPQGFTVSAVVAGGAATALAYQTTGTFAGLWTGTATLPAGTAGGPNSRQVDLSFTCVNNGQNATPGCTGTPPPVTDVQRAYAANAGTSGTIETAGVSESGIPDANSFQMCETGNANCTHNLVVTIALSGSLQDAQSVADPLYVMRFGSKSSPSQTGAVACPPGGQGGLQTNIATGCTGTYERNCAVAPTPCIPDAGCANVNPLSGGSPPPPADCVLTDNGLKTGQFRQGMATRMANQPCPNNWSRYPNIPNTDPRIVQVFITAYGSFGGSGNQAYPIQSFAAFYVTGWDGDRCRSDDPAGKDQFVGHFIWYINAFDPGATGTGKCNANTFGNCVTVLTR